MANGDGRNENRNSNTTSDNATNLNEFNKLITAFCSHNNELKSAGWDEFRKIISEFSTPISKISSCSRGLSYAISALQKKVDSTLSEYSGKLSFPGAFGSDPQKAISLVNKEISICRRNISSLENNLYKEVTIYDPILGQATGNGAITGKVLDEKVKKELDDAKEYLEDLIIYKDLVDSLLNIKNEFYTKFSELLESINSISFG